MRKFFLLLPIATMLVMVAFLLIAAVEARTLPETRTQIAVAHTATEAQKFITPTRTRTPFQPLPTSTITPTPTITNTPTPTATFTATATATPLPPADYRIQGFVGHRMRYSLDCEARAAVDLAGFFGISINEDEFLSRLPKSDNPEKGFVGSWKGVPSTPPYSYGVHPPPVAALLRQYGLNAHAVRDMSWDMLRAEIAANRPVIVWVVSSVRPGYPISYTASDGQTTTVAYLEHTVIVIGYTASGVIIQDGANVYYRSKKTFLNSWSVLGYRAVVVAP